MTPGAATAPRPIRPGRRPVWRRQCGRATGQSPTLVAVAVLRAEVVADLVVLFAVAVRFLAVVVVRLKAFLVCGAAVGTSRLATVSVDLAAVRVSPAALRAVVTAALPRERVTLPWA